MTYRRGDFIDKVAELFIKAYALHFESVGSSAYQSIYTNKLPLSPSAVRLTPKADDETRLFYSYLTGSLVVVFENDTELYILTGHGALRAILLGKWTAEDGEKLARINHKLQDALVDALRIVDPQVADALAWETSQYKGSKHARRS